MLPSIFVPAVGAAVSTYAIVRTLYVLLAVLLVLWTNRRLGIAPRTTLAAFAVGVPVGIVGAHLLDVVEYWDRYRQLGNVGLRQGSSIYGAFLALFPAVWVFARWHGVSALRLLDGGAPAMALGEAMTRIGCFLNGCCYGVPWDGPWAVTFPRDSFAYSDQITRGILAPGALHAVAVHPVQLYSTAIMTLTCCLLLYLVRQGRHADGSVFFTFLVTYGLLRLGVTPFRQEVLASMKLFSIGFIAAGGLGLLAGSLTRDRARARVRSLPSPS
jgi:phosphatidylglycerol:prolipoprotein diacylglycerol transferase